MHSRKLVVHVLPDGVAVSMHLRSCFRSSQVCTVRVKLLSSKLQLDLAGFVRDLLKKIDSLKSSVEERFSEIYIGRSALYSSSRCSSSTSSVSSDVLPGWGAAAGAAPETSVALVSPFLWMVVI
eukprot:TRINITY_DN5771_c0_g1_i5.p1 TRINITY_DN5771_c0_g1~~TRINITY_DN5771_c0_g1_i5.p1  ORF type:complete len:124 (-),score=22.49 TRINITY_DN5771_c0_g1_i5:3-374(-)